MDVILLERIPNLGLLGETVKVKDGYARNYLFPKNKALRATKSNKEQFDNQRDQIEARSQEQRADAEHLAGDLNGQSFTLIRQAGESGQLYGSVTARDLADATNLEGFTVPRAQFVLNQPIKTTGLHDIAVQLHPEVQVTITVNVARSPEEAERQARGEDPTSDRDDSFEDSYENPEAVAIPGVNL